MRAQPGNTVRRHESAGDQLRCRLRLERPRVVGGLTLQATRLSCLLYVLHVLYEGGVGNNAAGGDRLSVDANMLSVVANCQVRRLGKKFMAAGVCELP